MFCLLSAVSNISPRFRVTIQTGIDPLYREELSAAVSYQRPQADKPVVAQTKKARLFIEKAQENPFFVSLECCSDCIILKCRQGPKFFLSSA